MYETVTDHRFEPDGRSLPPPRLLAGVEDESTVEPHIVRGTD